MRLSAEENSSDASSGDKVAHGQTARATGSPFVPLTSEIVHKDPPNSREWIRCPLRRMPLHQPENHLALERRHKFSSVVRALDSP